MSKCIEAQCTRPARQYGRCSTCYFKHMRDRPEPPAPEGYEDYQTELPPVAPKSEHSDVSDKLDATTVKAIFKSTLGDAAIAEKYGVTLSQVKSIKKGRSYSSITQNLQKPQRKRGAK